jgi:hypothetical protein
MIDGGESGKFSLKICEFFISPGVQFFLIVPYLSKYYICISTNWSNTHSRQQLPYPDSLGISCVCKTGEKAIFLATLQRVCPVEASSLPVLYALQPQLKKSTRASQ